MGLPDGPNGTIATLRIMKKLARESLRAPEQRIRNTALQVFRNAGVDTRAAWMGQELLTTFADELGEVALAPGKAGVFKIWVAGELIWDRAAHGGFPDIKELKQLVRDHVCPQKDLGHSESKSAE